MSIFQVILTQLLRILTLLQGSQTIPLKALTIYFNEIFQGFFLGGSLIGSIANTEFPETQWWFAGGATAHLVSKACYNNMG